MEKVEFYLWDGSVRYRIGNEEHTLKQEDRGIIEFVLDNLQKFFPDALKALNEEYSDSALNPRFYDFRRVDTFVRCNFSEHDTLSFDIQNGLFHFEDVKCPRRGICKYEGIICKPKLHIIVPEEERKVAALYAKGFTADEIASALKKKVKTVKNQLSNVTKRLSLNRTKDLIKVFSVYNSFTIWE
ncbi:MAG: LuxR family transcriptional regulator [Prevotella sp.]|nr:LuxR family transcriptional regulator [Prevotella sp.]MBO5157222.1 LuxR family transcriptional regulator [Prevotella sp.]